MFDFEILDASILQHLRLGNWSQERAFNDLLSAAMAVVTSDGHLVIHGRRVNAALRAKANVAIRSSEEHDQLLSGGFVVTIFYRGKVHRGNLRHLEPMSYTTYRHPEVYGNFTDQQPGFTTITVASDKQTRRSLLDKWAFYAGPGKKSAIYVAGSGQAIQARLSCEEVSFEDVIDVVVAASWAIKEQRKGKMILGLSYTNVVVSPRYREVQVRVEDEYGPFERT